MATIHIVVNPVEGGWSPWDTRLGGTEESVVEWATRLKQRGHDVEVFHNGKHGTFRGVNYTERSEYLDRAGDGITLNCNYPDLPVLEPTYFLSNLTNIRDFDLEAFKGVIHPSHWARANLGAVHGNQLVVPHGYDPTKIYFNPEEKVPKTVLYASSPDRGLSELQEVWPLVVAHVPDAQLIVTYNGQIDAPNVICVGDVDDEFMSSLYRSVDIWCHPCLGGELFCMTGLKAQAAGCYPLYYPTMALSETIKVGRTTDHEHLAGDLIDLLQNGHRGILVDSLELPDWEQSTKELEAVLINA